MKREHLVISKFFSRSAWILLSFGLGGLSGCALPDAGVANRSEPLRFDFRPPADRQADLAGFGFARGGPDDTARFLAGLASRSRDGFQDTAEWRDHQLQMEARWDRAERRLSPIREFQRDRLGALGSGHVFYPFGGPDFLHANAFFPNAGTYALVGLEEIGAIPDLSSLTEAQLATSLRGLQTAISSSLDYSYFITKDMRLDLAGTSLRGVLPVLYVYLARTGHRIHSVDYVHLTPDGQVAAGHSGSSPGVRLSCSGCTVFYFRTDLSNTGSGRYQRYMANNSPGTTFIKSASYLLHGSEFSNVRRAILANSTAVLQDDSGIPFRFYQDAAWSAELFGNYVRTLDMFKAYYQTDLRGAYAAAGPQPLKFGVGYTFTPSETCLILARRPGTTRTGAAPGEVRPAIAVE